MSLVWAVGEMRPLGRFFVMAEGQSWSLCHVQGRGGAASLDVRVSTAV